MRNEVTNIRADSVTQNCSVKKILKTSQNSQENTYIGFFFSNKVAYLRFTLQLVRTDKQYTIWGY